jgi:disulfide bond formation protein DsbB
MTVERYLRLIAGAFVLVSLLLGVYHSGNWFWLTGFVSINLIQSAFTNWCPMMTLLRRLGVRDECEPAAGRG